MHALVLATRLDGPADVPGVGRAPDSTLPERPSRMRVYRIVVARGAEPLPKADEEVIDKEPPTPDPLEIAPFEAEPRCPKSASPQGSRAVPHSGARRSDRVWTTRACARPGSGARRLQADYRWIE